jgi:hypothetical protein
MNHQRAYILLSAGLILVFLLFFRGHLNQNSLAELSFTEKKTDPAHSLDQQNRNIVDTYTEELPRYEITNEVYAELYSDLTNIRALQNKIHDYHQQKKNLQSGQPREPVWDLKQPPQNNAEYALLLQELVYFSKYNISKGIEDDDIGRVQLYLATGQVVGLLSAFDLRGYSSSGNPELVLKSEVYARFNALEQKRKKRSVASIEGDNEPEDIDPLDYTAQGLALLERTNPVFFAQFEDKQKVDQFYLKEDEVSDTLTNLFMAISEFMSGLEFLPSTFNMSSESTLETAKDILRDVRQYPEYYGQTYPVDTLADLPFSVYKRQLNVSTALSSALWSAGVTALSDILVSFLSNVRFFAVSVVTVFPPEALVSGLHAYRGSLSLYKMHLLHAELTKQKDYFESRGQRDQYLVRADELAIEASQQIENTHLDEVTRGQINRSWAWGFALGYTRPALGLANKGLQRLIGSYRSMHLQKMGAEIALTMMANAQTTASGINVRKFWSPKRVADVLNMSPIKSSFLRKILNSPPVQTSLSLIKKAGPGLMLIAADSAFAAAISYQTVFIRLEMFGDFIDQIYVSPEVAVALTQAGDDKGSDFAQYSLRLFAPVCNYYAHHEISDQVHRPRRDSHRDNPEVMEIRLNRSQKCLELLALFTHKSMEELEAELENFSDADFSINAGRLGRAYNPQSPFAYSASEAARYIGYMSNFPGHYKIVWLTAIRAIYPHRRLPIAYYDLRNMLIYQGSAKEYGLSQDLLSPNLAMESAATRKNLSNFSYLLDYFSHLMCKENNSENVALCTDSRHVEVTDAYKILWERSLQRAQEADSTYTIYLRDSQNRGWFRSTYDRFKDGLSSFHWAISKIFASPADEDFRRTVQERAQTFRN